MRDAHYIVPLGVVSVIVLNSYDGPLAGDRPVVP
jgi:hypothetical protein